MSLWGHFIEDLYYVSNVNIIFQKIELNHCILKNFAQSSNWSTSNPTRPEKRKPDSNSALNQKEIYIPRLVGKSLQKLVSQNNKNKENLFVAKIGSERLVILGQSISPVGWSISQHSICNSVIQILWKMV